MSRVIKDGAQGRDRGRPGATRLRVFAGSRISTEHREKTPILRLRVDGVRLVIRHWTAEEWAWLDDERRPEVVYQDECGGYFEVIRAGAEPQLASPQ